MFNQQQGSLLGSLTMPNGPGGPLILEQPAVFEPKPLIEGGVYEIVIKKPEKADEYEPQVGLKLKYKQFDMPKKIYGEAMRKKADKVHEKFNEKNSIMGAIFCGDKGTGKSQLVEMIANKEIAEKQLPVIMVDEKHEKWVLEKVIRLAGACVLYFDEYEKVYGWGHGGANTELLTLFSDKTLGKVLFLVTSNSERDMSKFILNRPSRFLFRFSFTGTPEEIVDEICKDFKVDAEISEFIRKHAAAVEENIDSVIALAMNSAGYTCVKEFKELFEWLNVQKPSFKTYQCTISGMEETEENKARFTVTMENGQFSINDSVTGMSYGKRDGFTRNGIWQKRYSSSSDWIDIQVTFVESSMPIPQQIEVPIKYQWRQPRPQIAR